MQKKKKTGGGGGCKKKSFTNWDKQPHFSIPIERLRSREIAHGLRWSQDKMTDGECQPRQRASPCLCAHLGKTALMNSLVTSACNYSSCHHHPPPSLPPWWGVEWVEGGCCRFERGWYLCKKAVVFWRRRHRCRACGLTSNLHLPCVSPAACPVLCSGNGQYDKGSCVCYSGWKGPECDVPVTQCIDPLCSGHGTCTNGNCVCSIGYKGQSCGEGEKMLHSGLTIIQDAFFFFCFVFFSISPYTDTHTHTVVNPSQTTDHSIILPGILVI